MKGINFCGFTNYSGLQNLHNAIKTTAQALTVHVSCHIMITSRIPVFRQCHNCKDKIWQKQNNVSTYYFVQFVGTKKPLVMFSEFYMAATSKGVLFAGNWDFVEKKLAGQRKAQTVKRKTYLCSKIRSHRHWRKISSKKH